MYESIIEKCSESFRRFRRTPESLSTTIITIVDDNLTLFENNQTYDNVTYETDEESLVCNVIFPVLNFSYRFYIPIIIFLGILGNMLSCIVFMKTHLRIRSSSYYLATLAFTDLTFLISLLFVWVNSHWGLRIFDKRGWCELFVYISAVCSSMSVWLIVAFTVERFIAIHYPLHRPQMCTIHRAKLIIFILSIIAMIFHSYAFVTAGIVKSQNSTEEFCELRPEYFHLMKIINTVDSIITLIIPMILIVVMNIMIMRNFSTFGMRFRRAPRIVNAITNRCNRNNRPDINLQQIPSHSSSSSQNNGIIHGSRRPPPQQSIHLSKNNHALIEKAGVAPITGTGTVTPLPPAVVTSSFARHGVCQIPEITPRCIHMRSSARNLASVRNQQSITNMLLLISTVFIVLNLPSYLIRLCIFFLTVSNKHRPAILWCLQQFFMILYYTNFSINFLLYAMCGITFRRCLEQLYRNYVESFTRYLRRQRRSSSESS